MEVLVVFIVLAIIIFAASFVTGRRFGLLALALTAGSILSDIWGYEAGLVAGVFGIESSSFSTAIILMAITMLPAAILLFHGYAYKTKLGKLLGAGLFTVVALTFLVEPIGHILPVRGFGAEVYQFLSGKHDLIIGVGLIIAIVDLFLTKPAAIMERHAKH